MEIVKALAVLLVPVVLLFGVDPVLFWLALNGISLHVSFWGAFVTWMFVIAVAISGVTTYYLFSPDEKSPQAQRVIQRFVSEAKNEHVR